MAKGYWIALVDIDDIEAYKAYVTANAIPFRKYGARFIVRGGAANNVEGTVRSRTVVIEFPDYQSALDCYHSPDYAQAKALRVDVSKADIVVAEGYDGPQPDPTTSTQ
ncbi:DUF1330 domain-containing protein [Mesorhizobium sp. YR577]|uniref:DUF1330 domain-containing protein n=1 Tax=Mesorhizobium sp. YR577 TaxID=1884373 RepID=UPI0008F31008|nr:DUF1330 domain-containing protein [Mesorhizobium sp. YR577]SFU16989.1 Uncharacterized conserved protein, DUF1330 family [Mesorhizobium sp. YR577]